MTKIAHRIMLATLPLLALATPTFAQTQDIALEEVPTAWRLQDYLSNDVTVWFTGASGCTTGHLIFTANATTDDRNRFWALVMAAKHAGTPVGVFYTNANGECTITSFYMP